MYMLVLFRSLARGLLRKPPPEVHRAPFYRCNESDQPSIADTLRNAHIELIFRLLDQMISIPCDLEFVRRVEKVSTFRLCSLNLTSTLP